MDWEESSKWDVGHGGFTLIGWNEWTYRRNKKCMARRENEGSNRGLDPMDNDEIQAAVQIRRVPPSGLSRAHSEPRDSSRHVRPALQN
jgi:hypothetical protein